MGKRPSFLAKLEQELPNKAEPVAEVEAAASVQPKRLAKSDIYKSTVYIPVHVSERMREIAFTERKKMHDLIMEGLDRVLEARGHSERTGTKPS